MKRLKVAVVAAAALVTSAGMAPADLGQETIAKMAAVWDQINSYECTASVHESVGSRIQDRVYLVRFQKPALMRVDIIGGDGRGTAAVWDGGTTVRGHESGILSIVKMTVDLHSRLATDLRGTTIDQGNFGWLIARLKSQDPSLVQATSDGNETTLVVQADPSRPEGDVTKEVYILDNDMLPVEYFQYAHDTVVKHVVNTDLRVNVTIPASDFGL